MPLNKHEREQIENLCEESKPRYRLFLSADLVGSVRSKQKKIFPIVAGKINNDLPHSSVATLIPPAQPNEDWFQLIDVFYRDFDYIFKSEWAHERDFRKLECPDVYIKIWKTMGDELIYAIEVFRVEEIYVLVLAFIRTVRICHSLIDNSSAPSNAADRIAIYRQKVGIPSSSIGLSISGTAWCAGFPFTNKQIILEFDDPEDEALKQNVRPEWRNVMALKRFYEQPDHKRSQRFRSEFVGPSVDTGFRLCGLSNPRKMPISVELAYILERSTFFGQNRDELRLNYDGRTELKGVLEGAPYPFFWIDMSQSDDFYQVEDALLNRSNSGGVNVTQFCDAYFERYKAFIQKPKLTWDNNASVGGLPKGIIKSLLDYDEAWKKYLNHLNELGDSIGVTNKN